MVQTSDGGYAFFGPTTSFGAGAQDAWLVKVDSNGNMEWNKTYGGTANEYAVYIIQTADRGYTSSRRNHVFRCWWRRCLANQN